ncbi:DnaJ domain-containing protein [Dunaliella salina]|uniref:DnaJ domain-containing protein n=1 Tax=Dunaliella salina TaxID=3046 RepID=A0ABQ7GW83_DUNSA|nr:DnaJ domain-containing protein [Dunaliella salina]|eukprot:KAF5838878.1 DnaJ domain-containing protein [Dunaliella salina]
MDRTERSLYEILNVTANASQEEIKRAYRRSCLLLHPDKNPGDQEAVAKFQSLQKVYTILGDPERQVKEFYSHRCHHL